MIIVTQNLALDPLSPEEWREIAYQRETWEMNNAKKIKWPYDESYKGYLIVVPRESAAIGRIFVNEDDELHIAIHDEFRGRGFGKEALTGFVHAHQTMGTDRTLFAFADSDQKAAAAVLMHAGFVPVSQNERGGVSWELKP